jgi:hypothetical protein
MSAAIRRLDVGFDRMNNLLRLEGLIGEAVAEKCKVVLPSRLIDPLLILEKSGRTVAVTFDFADDSPQAIVAGIVAALEKALREANNG